MGVANVFHRVPTQDLITKILPAFQRALDEVSIAPLLAFLDVEKIRRTFGVAPAVELRTVGLFKKRQVARFVPSAGAVLGGVIRDPGHDVDKLLHHLRQRTELLDARDWKTWDELIDWAHNLPELFHGDEGPYGFMRPDEIPVFVELTRRIAARVEAEDRIELERLIDYLTSAQPGDGFLVYSG